MTAEHRRSGAASGKKRGRAIEPAGRAGFRVGLWLGLALGVGLFVGADAARAELRRVETVGTYGIADSERRRVIPRDAAIEQGTWEAVSRVALELLAESPWPEESGAESESAEGESVLAPIERLGPRGVRVPAAGPSDVEATDPEAAAMLESLRGTLGEDMLPYIRSYRILEDRGEAPVFFPEEDGIESEYVVVVEVLVDVDRVLAALEGAGLVLAVSQEGAAGRLEVEVVGLTRYAGFEAVVALLDGPIGATRIETLEFSRSRQLLAVEGPLGLEDLAVRLTELAGEGLVLVPMTVDPIRGRMRVQASYSPPADEPEGDGLEADFEGALPANR